MLHCVVSTLLQFQGRGLNYDDDDSPDASTNQEQRRQLPFVLQKMANRAVAICDPGINIFKSFIIMFSLFSSFYFIHKKRRSATLLILVCLAYLFLLDLLV